MAKDKSSQQSDPGPEKKTDCDETTIPELIIFRGIERVPDQQFADDGPHFTKREVLTDAVPVCETR